MTLRVLAIDCALLGLLVSGCGAGIPTRPSDAPKGAQRVDVYLDDALDLIDPAAMSRRLSGARIETVAGPLVGAVATPDSGSYVLWLPVGDYRVRVSLDGFEGYETDLGVGGPYGFNSEYFYISRPPHTLRGSAYKLPPGTTVRIVDGPNAGRATTLDAKGLYRFDGLLRSAPFHILFGSGQEVAFTNQKSGERIRDFVHHTWLDGPG